MSMTVVSGLFILKKPSRIGGDVSSTYKDFILYETSLMTSNEELHDFPATIRYYSPTGTRKNKDKHTYLGVLPSGTAVMAIAKLAIVPSKDTGISSAVLEAIDMFPVPGDPNDDDYEDRAPPFQFPYVFGLGHVTGPPSDIPGDGGRVFPAVVEQYVCGTSHIFDIECIYDSSPRWKNVPVPTIGSCFGFAAECESYQPRGILRVSMKNIVLNAQPRDSIQSASSASSPSKKRKFNPVLPMPARDITLPSSSTPIAAVPQTPQAGPSNITATTPVPPLPSRRSPKKPKEPKKQTAPSPPKQKGARSSPRGKKQPVVELDAIEQEEELDDAQGVATQGLGEEVNDG